MLSAVTHVNGRASCTACRRAAQGHRSLPPTQQWPQGLLVLCGAPDRSQAPLRPSAVVALGVIHQLLSQAWCAPFHAELLAMGCWLMALGTRLVMGCPQALKS